MDNRRKLRLNLTDESKAYGYTLCIWGSGAVLINAYGMPDFFQVAAYVLGAVIGFGLLAIEVYRGLLKTVDAEYSDDQLLVASMVHIIAALGTVAIAVLLTRSYSQNWAFLAAGINATVTYNILMLVEVYFYEDLKELEDRLHDTL